MSKDKYTVSGGFGSSYGESYKPAAKPPENSIPTADTKAVLSGLSGLAPATAPDTQATAPSGPPKDISTADFMAEVIEASKSQPVLIDFWAPWCGPCKQLAPALEKVVAEAGGKVKLVKMDIDKNPEIPGQMGIKSIPAVVAFIDGKPADAFMGAKPESEIREFIGKLVGPSGPSELDLALEDAAQLKSEGDFENAVNLYMQILQADPTNLEAKAGLGALQLEREDMDAARAVFESLSDEEKDAPEINSFKTALELAEQAGDLGDLQELMDKVEKKPKDHASRMELAIALNAKNKREEAADHLLEVIAKDRAWNEEAAKKQLLQFFEAWGMTDEATISARRKLSSILFS